MNIESDSPRTPPFEIITSSNPNDFLQDENEQTQTTTGNSQSHDFPSHSSCSCSPPEGTMKSTPRLEKIIDKIWKQPSHEEVINLGDSSTEDFPIHSPIRQIDVVFLDSSENTQNTGTQDKDVTQDNDGTHEVDETTDNDGVQNIDGSPAAIQEEITADMPPVNTDEEPASASPAKSSISSIHLNDFYNSDEF